MSTKTCTDCGTDLPLDAMHYDRDRNASDGFRDVCKLCRKEQREQSLKEKRAPSDVMRSVEDEALYVLDKLSPERGGISVPHMAELFEAVMDAFSGPQGLARHILSTFLAAKPGGPVRQKILADVLKLGQRTTETGMAQVSLDKLTTEEIEELHQRKLAELERIKPVKPRRLTVVEELMEDVKREEE